MSKQKISVIIPLHNEEENVGVLCSRLYKVLINDFTEFDYEIIFIDDGSTDNTVAECEMLKNSNQRIKLLVFSRNFGHHIAISAGLDFCSGDYVVMMDGDLQDQPEEILKLFNKMQLGFDVVYGQRTTKQFGYFKILTASFFNWSIKNLINEKIVINSTIFRIMSKEVVENLRLLREKNRYVIGLIGWVGFKHCSVSVEHRKRFKGKTKYDLRKQIGLALNAIFSFSDYFLGLIIKIGFIFILFSGVMITYSLIRKFIYQTPVPGWTSLITSVFLIGGIQIVILGVIGQYIGRIYIETKNRPLYILKKTLI